MAKKKVEKVLDADDVIPKVEKPDTEKVETKDEFTIFKDDGIPKVTVESLTQLKVGKGNERVKFVKDMDNRFVLGQYYRGKKGETKIIPFDVASILRKRNYVI
jgi:hypothetical protein